MDQVLGQISPIFALLLFGYLLQRVKYFEEVAYSRLQQFVFQVAIPCMLFDAMFRLEADAAHLKLSVATFLLMAVLLAVGFLLKAVLRPKYRFFPLLFTSFGFGTIGLPLFSTIFGAENTSYISIFGVGHELFIALFFLPFAQLYLSGERFEPVRCLKTLLRSPSMVMPVAALLIRGLGLGGLLTGNFVGKGILGAFSQLGGLTLTIMLVLLGYRIRFDNKKILMTCIGYALLREAITLAIGIVFLLYVVVPMTGGELLYTHACAILLFQHLSVALTIFVGRFCSKEDAEVINNVFVLNILFGFALSFLYLVFFVS